MFENQINQKSRFHAVTVPLFEGKKAQRLIDRNCKWNFFLIEEWALREYSVTFYFCLEVVQKIDLQVCHGNG